MDTEKAWMLPAGLAAEPVGDQWMLCDTAGSTVFTAQGPAASVVGCVATHRPLPRHLEATAAELEAAGLLCRPHTASGGAMSRRRLLAAGGATAVGVGVMTLPVAGVAASPAPQPKPKPWQHVDHRGCATHVMGVSRPRRRRVGGGVGHGFGDPKHRRRRIMEHGHRRS